jgi:hypothetical protein
MQRSSTAAPRICRNRPNEFSIDATTAPSATSCGMCGPRVHPALPGDTTANPPWSQVSGQSDGGVPQ